MSAFKWKNQWIPRAVEISPEDMNKHIFICGMTGCGKTTTMVRILQKFKNYPFLIIEPSTKQYRNLLKLNEFKDIKVFTVGDRLSPICFNPFYIQYGVNLDEHLNRLNSMFKMALSSYPPMDQIVNICLPRIYTKRGWDQRKGAHKALQTKEDYRKLEHKYYFPTINDLIEEVELEIKQSKYASEMRSNIDGALESRLKSMQSGPLGRIFNTYDFYSFDKLFSEKAIMELKFESGSEDLALVMYIFLTLANEYLINNRPTNSPLKHFTVIEEAHNLIDNNIQKGSLGESKSNPKGEVANGCENMLSEWRKYGEGVCVIEQSPTKISKYVIANANTKIVHKLDSPEEGELMAKYLKFAWSISSLLRSGARSISNLQPGEFLIVKSEDTSPTQSKTDTSTLKSFNNGEAISDPDIKNMMSDEYKMQDSMYYLSSRTSNKKILDQLTRKFIFTVTLYGSNTISAVIDRYKFAVKQSLAYLEYTEVELNQYLIQLTCEQLVKLGVVINDRYIPTMTLMLDDNLRNNVNTHEVELTFLDYDQAYSLVRNGIKSVADTQSITKELEDYLFPIDPDKMQGIAETIIKGN